VLYSGYHLGPSYLDAYVMHLRQSGVRWLHGYPSNVALLASHMLDRGYSLEDQISVVTLAAENLTDHQRASIAAAFGVTPYQHYGNAEAVANASECPYGTFHVDEDFAHVEAISRAADEVSALVGTNFTNSAFPLIRYDMGDVGTLTEQSCPCGRAGRALASVDGRLEDAIVLPSGARVGRLDHIFKDLVRIREAQIYQPEVSTIALRVVRGDGYTALDERKLLSEARQRLGDDPKISIEYVERLPRTRTGKLRMVVSDIATRPATRAPDHEGGC
jgi:phenylacetate-CoA ligase